MGARPRLRPSHVVKALEATAGIFTSAAALLKCAPNTIRNYVERYPSVKRALDEIMNKDLDFAETALKKAIRDPKHKNHMTAVLFYLRYKGRSRGYVEKAEIQLPDAGKVNVYLPKEEDEKK